MHEVKTFQYQSHEFRSILDGENALFVAKDVCEALEIENVSQACQNLSEDEKLVYVLHISGQQRETLCVTEPGLYRLIFRSNKPEAEKFRRWVFHEVLPQIRKTGTYVLPTALEERALMVRDSEIVCRVMTVSMRVAGMLGYKGRQKLLRANELAQRTNGTDFINHFHIDPEEVPEGNSPDAAGGPVERFLLESCVLGAEEQVSKADLYNSFVRFCEEVEATAYVLSCNYFFRQLRELASIRNYRPSLAGVRVSCFRGISVKNGVEVQG